MPERYSHDEASAELNKRDDPLLWHLWREIETLRDRVRRLETTVYPVIEAEEREREEEV